MKTISASRALTTEMKMDSRALKKKIKDLRLVEKSCGLVTAVYLPKFVWQAVTPRLKIVL